MTAFQNEREKVFGMRKLSADEYSSAGRYVEDTGCGTVDPLSMAEGVQQGDIFADGGSVLFWHCCGFEKTAECLTFRRQPADLSG